MRYMCPTCVIWCLIHLCSRLQVTKFTFIIKFINDQSFRVKRCHRGQRLNFLRIIIIISLEHGIMIQMTIKKEVEDFINNSQSEEKAVTKIRGQN